MSLPRAIALVSLVTLTARATPPIPTDPTEARWQASLAALGLEPDCVSTLGEFFRPTGENWVAPMGAPLERTAPTADGIYQRLSRTGGIPFWGPKDAMVRARARFDKELSAWLPEREDLVPNRGYARWTPAPGRDLLVVDHMRTPVSSATSIWEDTGKKVVLRAELPAEIISIEDRGGELLVHATDSFNAVALVWDVAAGDFVGKCLVRADAAASSPTPLAEAIFPATPVVATLPKAHPLWLLPPGAEVDAHYRIATVPARERVVVLYTNADGAAFVLAPWRDKTSATRLYRGESGRLWQLGWLRAGALSTSR